jgi:hypothetical protein
MSFLPSALNAKTARLKQSQRVVNSVIYLINECASKLKIQNENLALALNKIKHLERLPPELHFYHHALQKSMREQSISSAKISLSLLIESILNNSIINNWISISPIGNTDWENFVIPEAIRLAEKSSGNVARIETPTDEEFSNGKDSASAALSKIARFDPAMFDEIQENIRFIRLFSGDVTMGFTDMRILGAMLIRLPRKTVDPVLYFFEHIIHEASHIHLNCLMTIDPLILNQPDELFTSPLRSDPRPMIGVFHATFVSARIARSFHMLFNATGDQALLHPLAEVLDETIRGIKEIESNAKLTLQGEQLIAEMKTLFDSANSLEAWTTYDFSAPLTHRFGTGNSKVSAFHQSRS